MSPVKDLKYRTGRATLMGMTPIAWSLLKDGKDLYFQWHKGKIVLVTADPVGEFSLDDEDPSNPSMLLKEDSSGGGYYIEFFLDDGSPFPIEILKAIEYRPGE